MLKTKNKNFKTFSSSSIFFKRWIVNVSDYQNMGNTIIGTQRLPLFHGVGFNETGALQKFYERVKIHKKKPSHTGELVLSLFHNLDQHIRATENKSNPGYSLDPIILAKIMYHLEDGTLNHLSIRDTLVDSWKKTAKTNYDQIISKKKLNLFLDTVIASKNECLEKKYPIFLTEQILLGFLHHKNREKNDILRYLAHYSSIELGMKKSECPRVDKNSNFLNLAIQNNYETLFFDLLSSGLFFTLPRVTQARYGYQNQPLKPNCVETAFQNLCNIFLFNSLTGKFDFRLLPKTLTPCQEFYNFYQAQNFSVNNVNSTKVGQAFMNMVSNKSGCLYASGNYEMRGVPENFIPIMNYLFGSRATSLMQLSQQFSDRRRIINFNLTPTNDSINITIANYTGDVEQLTFRLTGTHGELKAARFESLSTTNERNRKQIAIRKLHPFLTTPFSIIPQDPVLSLIINDKRHLKQLLKSIQSKDNKIDLINAYFTYHPHNISEEAIEIETERLLNPHWYYKYILYGLVFTCLLSAKLFVIYQALKPADRTVILGLGINELILALEFYQHQHKITMIFETNIHIPRLSDNFLLKLEQPDIRYIETLVGEEIQSYIFKNQHFNNYYSFIELEALRQLLFKKLSKIQNEHPADIEFISLDKQNPIKYINEKKHTLVFNSDKQEIKFKHLIIGDSELIRTMQQNNQSIPTINHAYLIASYTYHCPINDSEQEITYPQDFELKKLGWTSLLIPRIQLVQMNEKLYILADYPKDALQSQEIIEEWLATVLKFEMPESQITKLLNQKNGQFQITQKHEKKTKEFQKLEPFTLRDLFYKNVAHVIYLDTLNPNPFIYYNHLALSIVNNLQNQVDWIYSNQPKDNLEWDIKESFYQKLNYSPLAFFSGKKFIRKPFIISNAQEEAFSLGITSHTIASALGILPSDINNYGTLRKDDDHHYSLDFITLNPSSISIKKYCEIVKKLKPNLARNDEFSAAVNLHEQVDPRHHWFSYHHRSCSRGPFCDCDHDKIKEHVNRIRIREIPSIYFDSLKPKVKKREITVDFNCDINVRRTEKLLGLNEGDIIKIEYKKERRSYGNKKCILFLCKGAEIREKKTKKRYNLLEESNNTIHVDKFTYLRLKEDADVFNVNMSRF